MSEIAESYSAETRNQIQRIPVWEPGERVAPGDFGRFRRGVFHRRGSLTEIWPSAVVTTSKHQGSPELAFHSDDGLQIQAGGSAGVELIADAHVRVGFSRRGATVLHAMNTRRHRISNLYTLLNALPRDIWNDRDALVTDVESAERYAVLCSASAGWQVDIGGDAPLAAMLRIAEASVTVTPSRGAGYSRLGTGPLLLTAFARQGWLKKDWEPLEVDVGAPPAGGFTAVQPFDALVVREDDDDT